MGAYSSSYGLTIDHVLGYTMVTAEGMVVVADKKKNPELYWGLSGVGPGGLGIVTDVTLKPTNASDFQMTIWVARFPVRKWTEVMIRYQNLLQWLGEREIVASCELFVAKKPDDEPSPRIPAIHDGVTIRCVHTYDPVLYPIPWDEHKRHNFHRILRPEDGSWFEFPASYIKVVGEFSFQPVQPLDFPTGQREMNTPFDHLSDGQIIANLEGVQKGEGHAGYMKAKGFFASETFTREQFAPLGDLLTAMAPNVSLYLSPFNGAIQRVPKKGTAFPHRDFLYLLSVEYFGPEDPGDVERGLAWIYQFHDKAAAFMSNGGVYSNFPDLDVQDYEAAFYRGNLGRMVDLKKFWDPTNYFRNPLSIRV